MVAMETARAGHPALGRLEPGDGELLRRFFYRLSPQTIYKRFFSPIVRPDQLAAQRLLELDGTRRQAIAALVDGEIVGVARYARLEDRPRLAELAVVVADVWQGQGIGTRMVRALAEAARSVGIDAFTVLTQADNRAVVGLVRRLAPDARWEFGGGYLESMLPVRAR